MLNNRNSNKEAITMKKFTIGIITGFLIGAIMFTSMGVLAGPQNITAFFNNIKVTINGKLVQADVAPFIYNGRTMVSLRFVSDTMAEILNLESVVKWNETTNTAEITFEKKEGEEMTVDISTQTNGHIDNYNKIEHNRIIAHEGNQYILSRHIHKDLTKKECGLSVKTVNGKRYLYIFGRDDVISEVKDLLIPCVVFDKRTFVEYDFYVENIKPFLDK